MKKKDRTRKCKKHPGTERIKIPNAGTRCKICYEEGIKNRREKNLNRAKEVHKGKYDYSLAHYERVDEKMKIICKKHGLFEQTIWNHLKGRGCPHCNREKLSLNQEDVIKKFIDTHGNLYDYSLVNYYNYKTKVKIICKKHGEFEQSPNKHINGQGCPVCRMSHGERIIKKILEENKLKHQQQKRFDGCISKTGTKLRFDFYIKKYNLCIEYDGEQHFEPRPFVTNSDKNGFKKIQENDEIKNEFCKKNSINLLRIPYYKKDNIKEILRNKFSEWEKGKIIIS